MASTLLGPKIKRRKRARCERIDSVNNGSYKSESHRQLLKVATARKYKYGLLDYKDFVADCKLSESYRPVPTGKFMLPDRTILKQFAQFYASGKSGVLADVMTVSSVRSKLSSTTRALEIISDKLFDDETIASVHKYISFTLLSEGLVTERCKPKFEFGTEDIIATQEAIWLQLDPNSNSRKHVRSGRFIVFLNAAIHIFNAFGSRISAILPKTHTVAAYEADGLKSVLYEEGNESKKITQEESANHAIVADAITGLRYKDLEVELRRQQSVPSKFDVIVTISQRFVKNNRNTAEKAIKTWGVIREDFLRDFTPYILAYAFADGAFQDFENPASLFGYRMSDAIDSYRCRWKSGFDDLHIFRESGAGHKPFSQYQFDAAFGLATKQAGYTQRITVHRIRQATVNRGNLYGITPEQHKHIFGQSVRTLSKHYMHDFTMYDAQGAAHGTEIRTDIAKHLRSAERAICRNLPTRLTAAQIEALRSHPDLVALRLEKEKQHSLNPAAYKLAQSRYDVKRKLLEKHKLYQEQQEYYKRQAYTNSADSDDATDFSKARWSQLMLLQPQHARIAAAFQSEQHPNEVQWVELLEDLVFLARQEQPCIQPRLSSDSQETCVTCSSSLSGDAGQRHKHNFTCCKSQIEGQLARPSVYCAFCTEWIAIDMVDDHIENIHLPNAPVDCGVFHLASERFGLLVKPGLCPFCLDMQTLPAQTRFRQYSTKRELMIHLRLHFERLQNMSGECPHPLCRNGQKHYNLAVHFEKAHGIEDLTTSIQRASTEKKRKRKREASEQEQELDIGLPDISQCSEFSSYDPAIFRSNDAMHEMLADDLFMSIAHSSDSETIFRPSDSDAGLSDVYSPFCLPTFDEFSEFDFADTLSAELADHPLTETETSHSETHVFHSEEGMDVDWSQKEYRQKGKQFNIGTRSRSLRY